MSLCGKRLISYAKLGCQLFNALWSTTFCVKILRTVENVKIMVGSILVSALGVKPESKSY